MANEEPEQWTEEESFDAYSRLRRKAETITKHVNRRSCARNEDGDCLFYNIPCSEVPKYWDECRRQLEMKESRQK